MQVGVHVYPEFVRSLRLFGTMCLFVPSQVVGSHVLATAREVTEVVVVLKVSGVRFAAEVPLFGHGAAAAPKVPSEVISTDPLEAARAESRLPLSVGVCWRVLVTRGYGYAGWTYA